MQFETIRSTCDLLTGMHQSTTMLAAQYFAYSPVDGGEFGPGAGEGAYFCSDTASEDACKAIVFQTAQWTSHSAWGPKCATRCWFKELVTRLSLTPVRTRKPLTVFSFPSQLEDTTYRFCPEMLLRRMLIKYLHLITESLQLNVQWLFKLWIKQHILIHPNIDAEMNKAGLKSFISIIILKTMLNKQRCRSITLPCKPLEPDLYHKSAVPSWFWGSKINTCWKVLP